MNIFTKIVHLWQVRNSDAFIKSLRKKGIKIGTGCIIRHPRSARIDCSRPALISIGNNVDINKNFQILTHDWSSFVFRGLYNDFINSSGAVNIGSNIYFGTNVIILKGVSIGDNCIIGAGSIVSHDIPANSVAAGVPCKVIYPLEDYYKKRAKEGLLEAVEYVKAFQKRFGKDPYPKKITKEFIYFVNRNNIDKYESEGVPIKKQLDKAYDKWIENHKSIFNSFDAFMDYVNRQ